jgi:hypothetical protein
MCSGIVSGTAGGTWIVQSPSGGLEAIQEYHTATFDQWVLARSDNSVTVRISSKLNLDTNAGYPVDTENLPPDIQDYLDPESDQQSDAPALVQLAQQVVQGTEMQAQAVVAILDWVRANISYDYSLSLPRDALSVYQNRSGTCAGFSNLSVALMRAAGIPARYQTGCALWALPAGGGHAWVEVYYPDLGWVPSEPQSRENFVDEHLVAANWWDFCGESGTNITYTELITAPYIHLGTTPYNDDVWPLVTCASISSWDRNPARSSVSQISTTASIWDTEITYHFEVESTHCYATLWRIEWTQPWISVSPSQGHGRTEVTVSIDPSGLTMGLNSGVLTMTTPYVGWSSSSVREIPVLVRLVGGAHNVFLPITARDAAPQ